jgi:hypothetical protein
MPPPADASTTDDPTLAEILPESATVAVIGCEVTLAVICWLMRRPPECR